MADSSAVNGNISFTTPAGSFTVDIASIKNTIQFERHFNVSAQVLQMAPRLEYIAFMAWSSAVSKGLPVPDDFDEFLDVVEDLQVVDEADQPDVNPTDGGQPAEH
jgi:hypothetical protein